MLGTGDVLERGPVAALAEAHGADAWRLALVAGADQAAATRAAIHALVIAAVEGGPAAERPAILALARSWALSSPGQPEGRRADELVVSAFWSLAEPQRAALWCTDRLALAPADAERVLGPAASPAAAASRARGLVRRNVCRRWRAAAKPTGCSPAAGVLAKVLAGRSGAAERNLVDAHARGCDRCGPLLAALHDPAAVVSASLPPAPDLVVPAGAAWRDHVGAPRLTPAERVRHAAAVTSSRRRPVTAILALVTAGSFAAATSQLAVSAPAPASLREPGPAVAVPGLAGTPRPAPPLVVRRQAVIPPLALEVALDPDLAPLLTPELAVVTPAVTAAPPPPHPAPPAAQVVAPVGEPGALLLAEPPPAEEQSSAFDITLPVPVPLQVSIDIDPACPSISVGFLRLALPCER